MPIGLLRTVLLLALLGSAAAPGAAAPKHDAALTAEAVEQAQGPASKGKAAFDPLIIKAEVLLDRLGFSPGEIDGHAGENFQKAVKAYQRDNELEPTGKLDQPTWDDLAQSSSDPVTRSYRITEQDVKGPFVKRIPKQYDAMAKLDRLAYRSVSELLAEKFHMSERLLAAMNKGKALDAGAEIVVADVDAMPAQGNSAHKPHGRAARTAKAGRVEVDKTERAVRVFDHDGKLIAFYPASIGSSEKPAPSGKFTVRKVDFNPTYRYDPAYGFKGQRSRHPVTVPPGPNNPVGLVWIDLSAKSYGIHGTPEPQNVSKTASHGCIRLTNWDALALAQQVATGTPVDFLD